MLGQTRIWRSEVIQEVVPEVRGERRFAALNLVDHLIDRRWSEIRPNPKKAIELTHDLEGSDELLVKHDSYVFAWKVAEVD